MVCAYLTTTPTLEYHGINHFQWQMTLTGNGGGGGGAVNQFGQPLVTMPNGSTLYAVWDATNSVVQYDAIVMAGTYLSIGYGTDMTNTDMVFWGANGASSVQQ